jgi:hypothetical protein
MGRDVDRLDSVSLENLISPFYEISGKELILLSYLLQRGVHPQDLPAFGIH